MMIKIIPEDDIDVRKAKVLAALLKFWISELKTDFQTWDDIMVDDQEKEHK